LCLQLPLAQRHGREPRFAITRAQNGKISENQGRPQLLLLSWSCLCSAEVRTAPCVLPALGLLPRYYFGGFLGSPSRVWSVGLGLLAAWAGGVTGLGGRDGDGAGLTTVAEQRSTNAELVQYEQSSA